MNIKLTMESSVDDFENSINGIMRDLEYHSERLGQSTSRYGDSRSRGKNGETFLQGFYIHVKSLKKIVELMREAEIFVADMADDPEDGDYARGQLQGLKQVFISICREARLASEEWAIVEMESTRHGGNPVTPRHIFYSLKHDQKVEPVPLSALPAMYDFKPTFKPF
jgi:hypothetical protein